MGAAAGALALGLVVMAGPGQAAAAAARPEVSLRSAASDWTTHRDIVFPDGWAIGGWEELTLHPDGSYRFRGHVHDSGGVSYDFGTAYGLRQPSGRMLTFATNGHTRGTCWNPFGGCDGSPDYDWDYQGTRAEVADALQTGFSGKVDARASLDLKAIIQGLEQAFGTVASVVAIVG